ncbi:dendrin [Opisthocomus hoazin]|uniref:dendrin n=1 Tax=Opisthocomus hoazin TaxID=30419 RepID=UPI003F53DAA4
MARTGPPATHQQPSAITPHCGATPRHPTPPQGGSPHAIPPQGCVWGWGWGIPDPSPRGAGPGSATPRPGPFPLRTPAPRPLWIAASAPCGPPGHVCPRHRFVGGRETTNKHGPGTEPASPWARAPAWRGGGRPEPPWTYRRVAGEYAYLEQRFVAELAPPWPPAPPRRLQDLATVPPPRCPPGQPQGKGGCGPRGRHPPPAPRPPLPGGRPGPPSYEAHMQRAQTAHARRGGPPPYVSPPAYDAPHHTLQLRPPRGPRSPPPAPRGRGAVPGGRSHTLPRAATETGHRRPRGVQAAAGGSGIPRQSQTLPRAAGSWERVPGGRWGTGGHVLIDATRVVVRAQYVPPPQRQQVRYVGGSSAPPAPPGSPPAAPGAALPPAAPSPPRQPPATPRSPAAWGGPRGRPPPRRPALYAQALREAVSRIRRHTAPDSDSDAEGGSGGLRRRCGRDPPAYSSSSSSLESTGAPPATASPPRA